MSVQVIVTVGIFALAFILWFLFTINLDPTKRLKGTPKFMRIISLLLGFAFLAMMWFGSLNNTIFVKVLLSFLAIGLIYNNLNGWLFRVKEKEAKSI